MIDSKQVRTALFMLALVASHGTPAQAGFEEWTSNGPYGGWISALAVDPQDPRVLYAGTEGLGVFRSIDGGDNWQSAAGSRLATATITALAVDPQRSDTVFAATNAGLFRSTDGGERWTVLMNGLSGLARGTALAVDSQNSNLVYVAIESDEIFDFGGVYRSLDGGDSWSRLAGGLPFDNTFTSVAIDPQTPTTLYTTTFARLYKSTDGGEQWQQIGSGLAAFVAEIAIDPLAPQTLYAATRSGMFKSTDGGEQWTAINTGLTTLDLYSLAIDPLNPSTLMAGTFREGVFVTTDGGARWSAIADGFANNAFINALVASPQTPVVFYAGAVAGGVYRRAVDDDRWTLRNQGLNNTFVRNLVRDPLTPSTLYAASASGVFKSTDASGSWQAASDGFNTPAPFIRDLAIAPSAPNVLYAAGVEGVFRTSDGGRSWDQTSGNPDFGLVNELEVDPFNPQTVYAPTERAFFQSTDGGVSWQERGEGIEGIVFRDLVIDPTDSSILYVVTTNHVFKSVDGALSWNRASDGIDERITVATLVIDPQSPSTLYLGTSFGRLYRSTDGAGSWSALGSIDTDSTVSALAVDPRTTRTLYAGTARGIYRTTNGGERWKLVGDWSPSLSISSLLFDPGTPTTLYAGTSGGGVYDIQLISGTTTLELHDGRFQVEVEWRDFVNQSDRGTVAVVNSETEGEVSLRSRDSTVASFFSPDNWELLAKVLDGRGINGHFWVFLAAATNVELTTTVTDTSCGTVATYLNPLGAPASAVTDTAALSDCADPLPPSCEPSESTICLGDGRFQIDFTWRDFNDVTGPGDQVLLPRSGLAQSDDSGLFEFFDSNNWELLVKVLDGCDLNGHFWVFAAAATNVEYRMRVTDTESGTVQEYVNPLGRAAPAITDTSAFATCP